MTTASSTYNLTTTGPPRLLDAGCGDATYAIQQGWPDDYTYVGIDADQERVETAERRGVTARIDDICDLNEPANHYDYVVAKAVLEHVDDPLHAVTECRRVLRPYGTFLAIVPSDRSYDLWGDYTHQRGFRRDSLHNLLVDAGFPDRDINISARMGWQSIGMAAKSIIRVCAPWTPYGYPRAWTAVVGGNPP